VKFTAFKGRITMEYSSSINQIITLVIYFYQTLLNSLLFSHAN
jgi:hypothetical protein